MLRRALSTMRLHRIFARQMAKNTGIGGGDAEEQHACRTHAQGTALEAGPSA